MPLRFAFTCLDLSENDSGCHPCVYWRKLHRRCLFEWFLGYWVSINRLCGFRTSSRIIWRAGLAIISRKRLSSLYKNDLPRASRRCWSNAPRGTWRLFVGTSYEVIVVAKTFHLHKATMHSLLRKISFVQLSFGQAGLFCRVFSTAYTVCHLHFYHTSSTQFVTVCHLQFYHTSPTQFVTYIFTTLQWFRDDCVTPAWLSGHSIYVRLIFTSRRCQVLRRIHHLRISESHLGTGLAYKCLGTFCADHGG